jgi:hypothetical protein
MNRRDVEELCRHLQNLGVDFVLVGGMAIELRGYQTGTEDVGFALTLRQYSSTMRKLSTDRRFRELDDSGTIGGAQFFTGHSWVDVDFINPRLFRGKKTDDFFITYLKKYRSSSTDLGPVAAPEVAWYMRLAIPDWEIYVQKILRDVRAGVPEAKLDDVMEIAGVLGTAELLEPRVSKTRETIRMTL